MLSVELIVTVVIGIIVIALSGYLIVIVNGIKTGLQETKASSAAEHSKLSAEIARTANELGKLSQKTENQLSAAASSMQEYITSLVKENLRELQDSDNAAHQSILEKLSAYNQTVVSAINGHDEMQLRRFDELMKALGTEQKENAPERETPREDAVEPQPQSVAVATAAEPAEKSKPEVDAGTAAKSAAQEGPTAKPDGWTVDWSELPAKSQELWEKKITELTIPPVSFEASQAEVSPKELVKKIKHDPMLCAKILAVANSAAQGQVKAVTSIERAAVQLGTNMLQIIISAYHMEAIFGHYPDYSKEHFSFIQRWSCGASVVAYHLAEQAGSIEKAMLSTAALISRLGSLLLGLIENGPDEGYRDIACEVERYDYEMERWGVSTPLLSERIALQWGLPEPMPTLLRYQEKPLFVELAVEKEDIDLMIISLAAVITSAYISKSDEDPLKALDNEHCAVLRRNLEALDMQQAVADAWQSKGMQREFQSIIE